MDGAVDAAAAEERGVSCVDDYGGREGRYRAVVEAYLTVKGGGRRKDGGCGGGEAGGSVVGGDGRDLG